MALPGDRNTREFNAFTLDGDGNPALNLRTISGGVGTLPADLGSRWFNAFTLDGSGNVAFNAVLSSGTAAFTSLTTPLVLGGTAASSTLTLQSTSGVGTSDAVNIKVGNNGAITGINVSTSGEVGIGGAAVPGQKLTIRGGAGSGFEIRQDLGTTFLKFATTAGTSEWFLNVAASTAHWQIFDNTTTLRAQWLQGGGLDIGANPLRLGSAVGTDDVFAYRSTTKTLTLDADGIGGALTLVNVLGAVAISVRTGTPAKYACFDTNGKLVESAVLCV